MNRMTDAELNRKLAEALGWEASPPHPLESTGPIDCRKPNGWMVWGFAAATDRNHLAVYVLPEVERRGLYLEFAAEFVRGMTRKNAETDYEGMAMAQFLVDALLSPPAVLAAAALKVLGGGE